MAVLGLSDSAEGDWGRLRGLQYAGLARLANARLTAHALAKRLASESGGVPCPRSNTSPPPHGHPGS